MTSTAIVFMLFTFQKDLLFIVCQRKIWQWIIEKIECNWKLPDGNETLIYSWSIDSFLLLHSSNIRYILLFHTFRYSFHRLSHASPDKHPPSPDCITLSRSNGTVFILTSPSLVKSAVMMRVLSIPFTDWKKLNGADWKPFIMKNQSVWKQ